MKRVLSLLFSFVFLALLLPVPARGDDVKYAAYIDCPKSAATKGEVVTVYLYMLSEQEGLSYNSYYFTLSYDENALRFDGATIGMAEEVPISDASNGVLRIGGYGAKREDKYILVKFTVCGAGDTSVTLTDARIDISENAGKDAPLAPLPADKSASITIRCGGYPVELPKDIAGIDGPAFVEEGGEYTFSANPGYKYSFIAKVGDEIKEVIDNGDGTYTVKDVRGKLVIEHSGDPVARTYAVEVTGSGADDVTVELKEATYGQDYTFAVNREKNYDYAISVTVNEQPVACEVQDDKYTISGQYITGPIAIKVTKVPQNNTTRIEFDGSGAGDLPNAVTSYTVLNSRLFDFILERKDNFDYQLSAKNASGETVPLTQRNDAGTMYRIEAEYITGGIITVTITKTEQLAADVQAKKYVKLNDTTVWLITAAPKQTLAATKGLYYNDSAMFWSPEYSAYAWLVTSVGTQDSVKTAAEAAVNIRTKNNTTLVYSGDVNKSGRVDINDAQYIYNVYNNGYAAIDDVEKFLRCDMNRDNQVDTTDVTVVVNKLLNR